MVVGAGRRNGPVRGYGRPRSDGWGDGRVDPEGNRDPRPGRPELWRERGAGCVSQGWASRRTSGAGGTSGPSAREVETLEARCGGCSGQGGSRGGEAAPVATQRPAREDGARETRC